MSFISDEQIQVLKIEQFIFHVVQHGENDPILLDETSIGEFEDFFLDRVRDTLKGNKFEFNRGSFTFQLLKEILDDSNKFVENSKKLAIDFHSRKDKRIKPGVIIIMRISADDTDFFSLIKYDHEQVLTYDLQDNTRAILQEISNSFTKSKESLHKSALISLNNDGGELIVIDKTVQYDITEFFKGFLNVKRKYTDEEMTQYIHDSIIKTAQYHRNELPPEITGKIRSISFNAIQTLDTFDADKYFDIVFGVHGSENIKKTFNNSLRKKNLDGESFRFDKKAITQPKEKKYRTKEGVRIRYGEEAEDKVSIKLGNNNIDTIITIKTRQLIEE